jgi:hypothetical protein
MNINNILLEIGEELESEKASSMTASDKKLHSVAQRLLMLERDLKAPGVARSTDERVERILEAIAKESF